MPQQSSDPWAQYEIPSPAKPSKVKRFQGKPKADPWAQYEVSPGPAQDSQPSPTADITANPKGEGLYRMLPDSQQGYTDTSQQIEVPFSRVSDAQSKGYHLHFDEEHRYKKDSGAEGPTLRERYDEMVGKFTAPIKNPEHPSTVVQQLTWAPRQALADIVNTVNAGARSIAGIPEYVIDTFNGIRKGDPAAIESLDPLEQGRQMYQQWQEMRKTDPQLADQNLIGSLAGMYFAGKLTHGAREKIAETIPETLKKVPESVRKGTQSLLGAGERPVRESVGKVAEEAHKTKADIIKENRAEAQKHSQAVAEAKAETTEAIRAQKKIPATQEKLETASRELQAQIETARNNALKIGNEKYSAVNKKLDHLEADGEVLKNALDNSLSKIKGSETEPPILKNIVKRINGGKAEPIIYRDLQGFYSELNTELSKGSLPGDVYAAYDTIHEAIGDEMQRIADSQGAGEQLKDARNYWRRMKQAFGKPYNPTDVATGTYERTTPEFARQEEENNRLRLLGSFDKGIPQTAEHISNLRAGLKSLGDEKPLREVITKPPAKPEPQQFHRPEVSTRQLREQFLDRWTKGESIFGRYQMARLLGGGLAGLIGGLTEGRIGAGVGGAIGATLGPIAIAKIVEMPAFREWLTRPPAGELEALQKVPYADRIKIIDGLKQVIPEAKKQGVKVSPALVAYVVASTRPKKAGAGQK